MNRTQALPYVGHAVDNALSPRNERGEAIPATARLVGWQCGFEPMFVAVWSYLDRPGDMIKMDRDEAEEIAKDYLEEIGWFGEDGPREADYIF